MKMSVTNLSFIHFALRVTCQAVAYRKALISHDMLYTRLDLVAIAWYIMRAHDAECLNAD